MVATSKLTPVHEGQKFTFCSVRLSVRTLGFQPSKTGSIPVPSAVLKYNNTCVVLFSDIEKYSYTLTMNKVYIRGYGYP